MICDAGLRPARYALSIRPDRVLDGADLWDSPFLERKTRLAELLRPSRSAIAVNEHIDADGAIVFEHACRLGAEGIVSKRIDASYRSGPFAAWIKVKSPRRDRGAADAE